MGFNGQAQNATSLSQPAISNKTKRTHLLFAIRSINRALKHGRVPTNPETPTNSFVRRVRVSDWIDKHSSCINSHSLFSVCFSWNCYSKLYPSFSYSLFFLRCLLDALRIGKLFPSGIHRMAALTIFRFLFKLCKMNSNFAFWLSEAIEVLWKLELLINRCHVFQKCHASKNSYLWLGSNNHAKFYEYNNWN